MLMEENQPTSLPRKVDEQFLKQLFNEHYKGLCLFARQYIFDNEKVEDIVQDVFLNIWEKGELNATDAQAKSYLFTSVRNRCLNYIRDNKKFNDNVEVSLIENVYETDKLEYRELEKVITNAIHDLPEKCREVFQLSRFQDMKYQQIADALGISVKTVEAQMSKALKVLRERLKGHTNGLFILIVNFFKSNVRVNPFLSVFKS